MIFKLEKTTQFKTIMFCNMKLTTKLTIEWAATIICIIASTWRALNMGGQGMSYLASACGQLPFIYRDYQNKNTTGMLLNTFYLFSASLGYYRWLYL